MNVDLIRLDTKLDVTVVKPLYLVKEYNNRGRLFDGEGGLSVRRHKLNFFPTYPTPIPLCLDVVIVIVIVFVIVFVIP